MFVPFARAHRLCTHVRPWLELPGAAGLAPPLAGFGDGAGQLNPVFFLSGLAVLSAGLIVLRAAHPGARVIAPTSTVKEAVARRLATPAGPLTAEEALAERRRAAGDTGVLIDALAAAASTFYAIAGQLPGDVSAQVVRKADDLRELVWLNRS